MKKVLFVLFAVFCMASCKKSDQTFYANYGDVFVNSVASTSVVHRVHLDKTTEKYVSSDKNISEKLQKAIDTKAEKIKVSTSGEEIIEVEVK